MAFMLMSCEDEEKLNLNVLDFDSGGFVRFTNDAPPATVGVNQISDLSYSFSLSDANNNVSVYDLKLYADLGGVRTDTVDVAQITSFPAELSFDADELASLLGVTVNDINFGDAIFFTASVTTNDGTEYRNLGDLGLIEIFEQPDGTFLDDDDDLVTIGPNDRVVSTESGATFLLSGGGIGIDLGAEDGYRQAFEFGFVILCPSVEVDQLVGTFNVVSHRFDNYFGPQGATREVIAGPGPNQLTIVGGAVPLDGADDLIITLNADASIEYGGSDDAIHFNTFGPGVYGDVEGTAFSCIGVLDLTINSPGFIPNFLILSKQ